MYLTNIDDAPVIRLQGADVVDLLQRISTNDVSPLASKRSVTTIFTTEKGRIAEIASVVPLQEHDAFVLFLAGCHQGDFGEWLSRYIIMEDVVISPEPLGSGHWLLFEEDLTSGVLEDELRQKLLQGRFLSVTEHYRGHHWTRIVDLEGQNRPHTELLEALTHVSSVPFSVFEASRIKAGIPWAGKELTDQYNPMEALAREHISFTKGCYIGQEVIARLDSYKKVSKALARVKGQGNASTGPLVAHGKDAGNVTSAIQIDAVTWMGIAYVRQHALSAAPIHLTDREDAITILDHHAFDIAYGGVHV